MKMKKSFWTLILSGIGAIILAGSAFYFGAPLFGWLIMAAIFVIYLMSAWKIFRGIASAEAERNLVEKCREACDAGKEPFASDVQADGLLSARIRFMKNLVARRVSMTAQDLPILKSTWSAAEDSLVKNNSGIVVLLGLMGTFFGLMLSINAAGGAIDASATSETTLGIIQNIFASMKGIFGSSLCGLWAALVLNAVHATYQKEHDDLIGELDEFTLFYLIPKTAPTQNSAVDEIRHLMDALKASDLARAEDFRGMIEASKSAEASRTQALAESMNVLQTAQQQAFAEWQQQQKQNLMDLQNSFAASVSKVGEQAVGDLASAQKTALEGMLSVVQKSAEDLSAIQKKTLEEFSASGKNASAELCASLSQVTAGLAEEMQKLSTSVRSIESGVVDGLEKEISNLSDSVATSISNHLEQQMANSEQQWSSFMQSLKESMEQVAAAEKNGLEILHGVAEEVASRANDSSVGLSETVTREIENLSQKVQSSFTELAKSSETLVASERDLIAGIENRVQKLNESTDSLGTGIEETAKLMRVNQSELAANLEMFGKGIEAVLLKLSGDVPERENEQNFIEQLNASLQSFQERSGEVLLENALKTQEILLEILDQVQKTPAKKAE